MAIPRFLASAATFDQASISGDGCTYPALAIGTPPVPTTVVVGTAPLLIVAPNAPCLPAPPGNIKIPPCPSLIRKTEIRVNDFLKINGVFPCLCSNGPGGGGDYVASQNGKTSLTAPAQHIKIVIGTNRVIPE